MRRHLWLFVAILFFASESAYSKKGEKPASEPKMDHAATVIWNLNHMETSAGWYVLKSLKTAKVMDHDLLKAFHQIDEADKTYARLRGRADEKYLQEALLKLERAQQARALLETDLREAFDQLNDSIKEVLITDEERRKKSK